MLAWAAYLLVVSGILSLAAFGFERAIRPHGFATRWIWVGALLGSLALPLVSSSTGGPINTAISEVHAPAPGALRISAANAPREWTAQLPARLVGPKPVRLNALIEAAWLLSSAIAASILIVGWWYGHRCRRRWSGRRGADPTDQPVARISRGSASRTAAPR